MKKTLIFLLFLLTGLVVTGVALLPWVRNYIERSSPRPVTLGVQNGHLTPCPDSPNCVSSYDLGETHGMEKIPFTGSPEEAQRKLQQIIQSFPRANIITNTPSYIHAEFRSATLNFIDDVEFQFGDDVDGIHFRSAARLGHGDMGANRQRMEEIKQKFLLLE